MLVFADAALERALDGAAWGSFFNCGQVCSGVERIFVEEPLYDRFVAGLAERAQALRIGRGDDFGSDLGPLISEEQRAKVEALVETARERVVTGGRRPETGLPGWFYEPTVIAGSSDELRGEEIFGPVVTVEPFGSEEEAVRLANDTRYGLGASIWTRDLDRARRVAGRLEAGSVWTNDVAYSYAAGQSPWGGFKDSGLGRTHSKHGFYACTQVRFVEEDSGRLGVPWWFPYDELAVDGFKGVLGTLYGQGLGARAGAAWRHRRGLVQLGRRYLR
jgi:succinate-semialdehyde dehydrogenase/glutarate-semialdehyde dehydrogenase